MRLLTVTNLYPPQHLGGFGMCIQRLVHGLEDLGYDAHVLSSDQTYLGPGGGDQRVIRSLELLGSYENGISRLNDSQEEQRRTHQNLRRVRQVLDRLQPQACLVGNLDLLGTDLLHAITERGTPTIQHVGFMAAPFPLEAFPKEASYSMAFASREAKRLLAAQGFPVEGHPVVHPPLAPDTDTTRPHQPEQRDHLRIGYSGLLMHSKGVHNVLEACVMLKQRGIPFRLEVAGKAFAPDYGQQLRTYAIGQGIDDRVHWLGFLEGQSLHDFYRKLDVLVFPSLHPESFGMVVAEAMAQGVVPISSGVGGAFEVITHGVDGLLVQPGSSSAVAEALLWCHSEDLGLRRLSRNAQRHALSRFTATRSARVLDETFRRLQTLSKPSMVTFA